MSNTNSSKNAQFLRVKFKANAGALPVAATGAGLQAGDRFITRAELQVHTIVENAAGVKSWLTVGPGSVQPANRIAFGNATGTGLTSDPNFLFDPALSQLTVQDIGGVNVHQVVGSGATRGSFIFDSAGIVAYRVNVLGATRQFTWLDAAGIPMFDIDTAAAVRQMTISDDAGNPMHSWITLGANLLEFANDSNGVLMHTSDRRAANRFEQYLDPAGLEFFRIESLAANRAIAVKDLAGADVLRVSGLAVPRITASVPIDLAVYTVGALPAGVQSGQTAYASNARVGVEGGGAGTGAPVVYKAAGPAGAGWYTVFDATALAAA